MKKYLEKNYLFNISMENVPKNFRFELEDEFKINLKKQIDRLNLIIQNEKNKAIENNDILCCKDLIYGNKLNIYYYNGDFYNYYRTFLKYKKYCFKGMEEYEKKLENDDVILHIHGDITLSKENGYIEYCNTIKKNIDMYEKSLEDLYLFIIDNL
jgi:hypothetical protein